MSGHSSEYKAGLQRLHEELTHTLDRSTVSKDLGWVNHDEGITSVPAEGTKIKRLEPIEPKPRVYTETEKQEILDINSYSGLYGRLLLASQSPESEVKNIINPAIKGIIEPSQITISRERNYNPITQKLSSDERNAAWKGIEFDEAYAQWRTKLTKSIKSTTDEKIIAAIAAISGKLASEFTVEDADRLYEAFCKGKSNTTAFAQLVVSNIQTNGKADAARIKDLSSGIEWLAGGLFGKQTATAVSRIVELETEIVKNPTGVVQKVFSDKERINNLTGTETKILAHLYDGLHVQKIEIEPKDPTLTEKDDSTIDKFFDYPEEKMPKIQDVLPAPLSGVTQNTPPAETVIPEKNIITLEKSGADFVKDLNRNLSSQTKPDATFSIPIETLKGYLTSIAGDKLIYEGNLTIDKDNNEIVIKGLKIDGGFMGGKITMDLSIINTSKGINAHIQNYEGRGIARGTVEQQVNNLNSKFREIIDGLISAENPAWKSSNVAIAKDRIMVGFHDTRSTAGNLPA